jgi:hypothetical protein
MTYGTAQGDIEICAADSDFQNYEGNKSSKSTLKSWTKVLAGSGVLAIASTLALSAGGGRSNTSASYSIAQRRSDLGGEQAEQRAASTIKLHTACAPLHVLDFRPDPTTWKKNMGARIIVRSQANPELAFDRGHEMIATHCGAYEIDSAVLAPGDEFTFALYEKNGPNGPAFRKDAGCISSAAKPDSCLPQNNLGRSPNNMFAMQECTEQTFQDSAKTFYDRVYKESDGREFVWGSCHSDCAFSQQSELALCQLDAQQEDPSTLFNSIDIPQLVDGVEHTKASQIAAASSNEMTAEEVLAMDKAALREESESSSSSVFEPTSSSESIPTPENETPAQKIARLQQELKEASERALKDAEEKKAAEDMAVIAATNAENEVNQATTTATDAAAQAKAEVEQPQSSLPTVEQLNDLQQQQQQQQQTVASPAESSTTTATSREFGWTNDAAVKLEEQKEGRKDGPCNYDGCPIEEIIAAQQAAIREQEELTAKAKAAEAQAAEDLNQAKIDNEAEIARIEAESQAQISRQTSIEKGEIADAKRALNPTTKSSSSSSSKHRRVEQMQVPRAGEQEEAVVEESGSAEDQAQPLSQDELDTANSQFDEIDEILAHASDPLELEKEHEDALENKVSEDPVEDVDFSAAKKALAKAAKVEAHKKAVQKQLDDEKAAFELAQQKKAEEAAARKAAKAKARADAIRFAGKSPEEIELMKRMDALDAEMGEIQAEDKKANQMKNKHINVGVSPEEQIMLDTLDGSMDEESAKEASDALASIDFDDSVFDSTEEEQEGEVPMADASIGEAENESSSTDSLEGFSESSYDPTPNADPMSLKPRRWKKVATTVPLSEGTDNGAIQAKLDKKIREQKKRDKVDPETGLTADEQKLIDSLNFNTPAKDSFANDGDEAGEAALGERKSASEETASLGLSVAALTQIKKNRVYNEAMSSLGRYKSMATGEFSVANKFEMAARQARELRTGSLGESEDEAKASLEARMAALTEEEEEEEEEEERSIDATEQAVLYPYEAPQNLDAASTAVVVNPVIDPLSAQYLPEGVTTSGMTEEELELLNDITGVNEEKKKQAAAAKEAAEAATEAERIAKENAPKPYHEKGMIVINNVKVPHNFKTDPYKGVACNPSPTCVAGVPIPGIGCCPAELVDEEEPVNVVDSSAVQVDDDVDESVLEELAPTSVSASPAVSFSEQVVDERTAPSELVQSELATTRFDFTPKVESLLPPKVNNDNNRHSKEEKRQKQEQRRFKVFEDDEASTGKRETAHRDRFVKQEEDDDDVDVVIVKKEEEEEAFEEQSTPIAVDIEEKESSKKKHSFSSSKKIDPKYDAALEKKDQAEKAAEKARQERIEAERVAAEAKKAYEDAMKVVGEEEKNEDKKAAEAYRALQKVNHLNDESRYGESRLGVPGKKIRKVCEAAKWKDLEWPFNVANTSHPSCQSQNGGVNDMGSEPQQCHDDLASVRIAVSQGKAECLLAQAQQCKIPMHDFKSLNYDWTTSRCQGVWAAPLWMSPDTWQWGPGSGEIDGSEFCERKKLQNNFAGGGHEVEFDFDQYNLDEAWGHTTIRKDDAGIITVATCKASEAESNGGECFKPTYKNCKDCEFGERDKEYACWCNEDPNQKQGINIYGSGGCAEGTDCMWTLLSDVWNGVKGDSGYQGCMGEVPSLGVDKLEPNFNSHCEFSVENILVKGSGLNGAIQWGKGSPNYCRHLTVQSSSKTTSTSPKTIAH